MVVSLANREDPDQTASEKQPDLRDFPRPDLGPNIGPFPITK